MNKGSEPTTMQINDVSYIREDSIPEVELPTGDCAPYLFGHEYHIETVSKFYLGRLISVTPTELVIDKASWVADTGRYHKYAQGGSPSENEPIEGPVIIGRGAIVVAFRHGLIKEVL